jgi:hypothetical protein
VAEVVARKGSKNDSEGAKEIVTQRTAMSSTGLLVMATFLSGLRRRAPWDPRGGNHEHIMVDMKGEVLLIVC